MKLRMIRRPTNPASTWLWNHRSNVTSQCGEDGILAKIFEVIGQHGKVCVEFGAWDGVLYSNTHSLIRQQDWTGYLIEANAEKFKTLQHTYRDNPKAHLVNRYVQLDKGQGTLDEILAEQNCPREIDLLCIDVDGIDYYIWEGLAAHTAKVIVIEFNPTVPNDVVFVQERTAKINQGCSLLALTLLAKERGYELVCANKWNAIFVRAEYFPLFKIADNSPDAMYQPHLDGRIFHGYDGTIHIVGMPELLWQGVPVRAERLQVLPANLRVFGDAQRS
ncbi:MAG: hypothetical protein U0573_09840 [Phycisphaerales bacterium]|nr:hypothetical protein [Planctomycetota bacterium]